jgi:uncharacterized membrane protein YjjB (DUF3815 family)
MKLIGARWVSVQMIMPVTAAFVVASITFLLTEHGWAQLVGLPLLSEPENLLGGWAPWLGVLVVGVGTFVYHSAPRRSLPWLLVVLYAAWIGQFLGSHAFGGYVGGFIGALVMTPVAYLVERVQGGPPALVSFLPAFWLLVPGALSLIGLTEFASDNAIEGIQDFLGALGSILAIALGVLCGYPLYRSLTTSYERVGQIELLSRREL